MLSKGAQVLGSLAKYIMKLGRRSQLASTKALATLLSLCSRNLMYGY